MTCDPPPHPLDVPHLATCEQCKPAWGQARNKIIQGLEKEREKPKNNTDEQRRKRVIPIPDAFPGIKNGKRVLAFLDPAYGREYDLHGARSTTYPNMQPRDLPCPEPEPSDRPGDGEEPTEGQIKEAYAQLNATNPVRTCLGAPPKQLQTLFRTPNVAPKDSQSIWARIIAPHLMKAVGVSPP